MRRKLPILVLALIILLQAFVPAVYATSKIEAISSNVSLCPFDITSKGAGNNLKFTYKNNPMDNPKAAQDIIENPAAVYGYSPNPNSTRIGEFANKIDWYDPNQVEIARQSRQEYHMRNQQKLEELYSQGYSTEDIAHKIVNERNANRLNSYLNRGDMEGYKIARKSNLDTYQNAGGPTPELLLKKYGSWEGVINAALRGNLGMDACVGLYDLYYGGK